MVPERASLIHISHSREPAREVACHNTRLLLSICQLPHIHVLVLEIRNTTAERRRDDVYNLFFIMQQ
jgi:hypothetical protein